MDANDREVEREEAMRPVEEAGGGESEGFEQAERQLIENAEHGDGDGDPSADQIRGEDAEAGRSGAEYGEADAARPADGPDA